MEMPSLGITSQDVTVKTELRSENHILLANMGNLDLLCAR